MSLATAAGTGRWLADQAGERIRLRGVIISHLMGFCLLAYLFTDHIWMGRLPYTNVIDIPVRLLVLWLLVDRTGRIGRVSLGIWDWLNITFMAVYGAALVFADLFLVRNSGFINYLEWLVRIGGPYVIFLAIREASKRRGFSLEILLGWILAALSAAALLGIGQAANVLNLREISSTLYHWQYYDLRAVGPSAEWQARGPMPHANTMAFLMVVGFSLLPAAFRYASLRIWVYASGVLFAFATFATYSRMGAICILVVMAGWCLFYAIRSNVRASAGWGMALVALTLVGVSAIYAFDVQRFKAVLDGQGSVDNVKSEFGGWQMRREGMKEAYQLGLKYPIFGLGATGSGNNRSDVIVKNSFTFSTLLTGLYGYTFVQYGVFGILYVAISIGFFLVYLLRRDVADGIAASMFATGLTVFCFGISENSLFLAYVSGLINAAAAIAVISSKKPKSGAQYVVR